MKIALKSSLLAAFVALVMFVSTCYADTRPQVFSQYGFSAVLPPQLKRNYAEAPKKAKTAKATRHLLFYLLLSRNRTPTG